MICLQAFDMTAVNLTQAKARLNELSEKVEARQKVVIARYGKAVAHLPATIHP